jgi:hypothetical protein
MNRIGQMTIQHFNSTLHYSVRMTPPSNLSRVLIHRSLASPSFTRTSIRSRHSGATRAFVNGAERQAPSTGVRADSEPLTWRLPGIEGIATSWADCMVLSPGTRCGHELISVPVSVALRKPARSVCPATELTKSTIAEQRLPGTDSETTHNCIIAR